MATARAAWPTPRRCRPSPRSTGRSRWAWPATLEMTWPGQPPPLVRRRLAAGLCPGGVQCWACMRLATDGCTARWLAPTIASTSAPHNPCPNQATSTTRWAHLPSSALMVPAPTTPAPTSRSRSAWWPASRPPTARGAATGRDNSPAQPWAAHLGARRGGPGRIWLRALPTTLHRSPASPCHPLAVLLSFPQLCDQRGAAAVLPQEGAGGAGQG